MHSLIQRRRIVSCLFPRVRCRSLSRLSLLCLRFFTCKAPIADSSAVRDVQASDTGPQVPRRRVSVFPVSDSAQTEKEKLLPSMSRKT